MKRYLLGVLIHLCWYNKTHKNLKNLEKTINLFPISKTWKSQVQDSQRLVVWWGCWDHSLCFQCGISLLYSLEDTHLCHPIDQSGRERDHSFSLLLFICLHDCFAVLVQICGLKDTSQALYHWGIYKLLLNPSIRTLM